MALNLVPTHWIPSYSSDGTNMTLPLASFDNLTSGEAHTSTGDIRKIAYEILKKLHAVYAAEATEDQPQKMVINKSQNLDSSGNIVQTFSVTFIATPASVDVASE
jgi:hypothetical protein